MATTIGFLIRMEFYNANIDSALSAERDRLFGNDNADYYSTYYVKQAELTEEQQAFLACWEEAGQEYWMTPVREGDTVEWKSMQRGSAWSHTTASTPITHMVGIGPHHEMNEVFTLDQWAAMGAVGTPPNRQWLRITTATEADFAAWMAARREFETYDHRPYEDSLDPVEEAEAMAEHVRRCAEAEATMAALEIKDAG